MILRFMSSFHMRSMNAETIQEGENQLVKEKAEELK